MLGTQIGVKMTAIILLLDTTKQYIRGEESVICVLKASQKKELWELTNAWNSPLSSSLSFSSIQATGSILYHCVCEESIKRLYLALSECWRNQQFSIVQFEHAIPLTTSMPFSTKPKPMVLGLIKRGP